MGVLAAANELAKLAELLGQGEQDLVLVVELVLEEGDELLARALRAEGEGDRRQPADGREPERDIVRLELVCDGRKAAPGQRSRATRPSKRRAEDDGGRARTNR